MAGKFRLKLVAGTHHEPYRADLIESGDKRKLVEAGRRRMGVSERHGLGETYYAGDVIETDRPLHKIFKNKWKIHRGPVPAKKSPPPDPRRELHEQSFKPPEKKAYEEPTAEDFQEEDEEMEESSDLEEDGPEEPSVPKVKKVKKKKKKKQTDQ